MPFIYILHFDVPLAHAQHYAGSADDILARLHAHLSGQGARLTQVLREKSMTWSLGAVAVHTGATGSLKQTERALKNQKNSRRYCTLCCGHAAKRIPGTLPLDPALLKEIS